MNAETRATLKHAPGWKHRREQSLLLQIAKIDLNYKLQLLASEYQKQSLAGILWKRCS